MLSVYANLLAFFTVAENRRQERGATAVEYGLLVGLIAVVIIVAVTLLGTNLSSIFTKVAGKLTTV